MTSLQPNYTSPQQQRCCSSTTTVLENTVLENTVLENTVPENVDNCIAQLRHWTSTTPLSTALWQREQGRWLRWRWIDLLREAENLVSTMQQHGLPSNTRIGFCGDLSANILITALAAQIAQCRPIALPRALLNAPDALLHSCNQQHLLYVVTSHQDLPAISRQQSPPRTCLLTRETALIPFGHLPSALLNPPTHHKVHSRLFPTRLAPRGIWAQEGTERHDSVNQVVACWLETGDALILPERPETATVDLQAAFITGIIGSPQLLQSLRKQTQQQFSSLPLLKQKLYRWSAHKSNHPLKQTMQASISSMMGWRHLQQLEKVLI